MRNREKCVFSIFPETKISYIFIFLPFKMKVWFQRDKLEILFYLFLLLIFTESLSKGILVYSYCSLAVSDFPGEETEPQRT